VAVGLERAHPSLLGQCQGLAGVGFGWLALRRLVPCGDLAEKTQGIRLVAALLVLAGDRQRPLGKNVRLLQAVGQHQRLPQGETTARLGVYSSRCRLLLQRLRKQRYGISDAPREGVRRPQGCKRPREKEREVRLLTEAHGPLEQEDCAGQVALAKGQQTDPR
jgi:hypothetical protein